MRQNTFRQAQTLTYVYKHLRRRNATDLDKLIILEQAVARLVMVPESLELLHLPEVEPQRLHGDLQLVVIDRAVLVSKSLNTSLLSLL
jgi:hypothetical protein